jgi:hypothetical protein
VSANIAVPTGGRPVDIWGSSRVAVLLYTGPVAYPNTGGTIGDPITAADVGLKGILGMVNGIAFDPVGGLFRNIVYDPDLGTIRWFVGTTGVEVANGVDLSAYSAIVIFLS